MDQRPVGIVGLFGFSWIQRVTIAPDMAGGISRLGIEDNPATTASFGTPLYADLRRADLQPGRLAGIIT